jgi:hypothetical protein
MPIGDGETLQSIPVIKKRLSVLSDDEPVLKFLHHVIFGNEGESKSRKKRLLEFKGLSGGSTASTDAVCAGSRLFNCATEFESRLCNSIDVLQSPAVSSWGALMESSS